MVQLQKFNLEGKKIGELEAPVAFSEFTANSQLIKDYLVAIRNNARQWSASTKGRSEVKHTTKKPFPQKGTGNARQGSLVAPQFRGGGIVFGPKPKVDQHVKINKKERRAAVRSLITEKVKAGSFVVLDEVSLNAPKTKNIVKFITNVGFQKKVLFIGESEATTIEQGDKTIVMNSKTSKHDNLTLSLRNLQGVKFTLAKNLNAYDLINANQIVATEKALNELAEWLS